MTSIGFVPNTAPGGPIVGKHGSHPPNLGAAAGKAVKGVRAGTKKATTKEPREGGEPKTPPTATGSGGQVIHVYSGGVVHGIAGPGGTVNNYLPPAVTGQNNPGVPPRTARTVSPNPQAPRPPGPRTTRTVRNPRTHPTVAPTTSPTKAPLNQESASTLAEASEAQKSTGAVADSENARTFSETENARNENATVLPMNTQLSDESEPRSAEDSAQQEAAEALRGLTLLQPVQQAAEGTWAAANTMGAALGAAAGRAGPTARTAAGAMKKRALQAATESDTRLGQRLHGMFGGTYDPQSAAEALAQDKPESIHVGNPADRGFDIQGGYVRGENASNQGALFSAMLNSRLFDPVHFSGGAREQYVPSASLRLGDMVEDDTPVDRSDVPGQTTMFGVWAGESGNARTRTANLKRRQQEKERQEQRKRALNLAQGLSTS